MAGSAADNSIPLIPMPKPASAPKPPSTPPQISEAEWVVMKVLWERAPLTTSEVVEALEEVHWKPKTIHTLLSRLVKKGALGFTKSGREYQFQPRVQAAACEQAAARSFLDRFFEGDLAPFLARFVERERLKPAEIERLKRILEGQDSPP